MRACSRDAALVCAMLLGAITGVAAQTTPPASPDLPDALLGTYALAPDGCANATLAVQVTPRSVVTMSMSGDNSLVRATTTRALGDWTVAVGGGDDMPRVLLRPAGEGAGAGIDRLLPDAKLRDDQLPGPQAPVHLVRCDELPPALALLHGEGLAALHAFEAMEPPCAAGQGAACVDAFMSYADLNKDGRLNPAELARVARGATWFAQMSSGTTAEELETGLAASLVGGVAVGEVVVHSYDYDSKGSVTVQQLLQDRGSIAPRPQPRSSAVPPVAIGSIGPQLGPLMALLHLLY